MLGYLLIGFVALGVLSIATFPPIRQETNYRGNKTYYYRHESDFVSEYSDGNPLCKGERASASDFFTCYAKDITSAQEKICEYYKKYMPLNPKPIVVKCKTEIIFGHVELCSLASILLMALLYALGVDMDYMIIPNGVLLAIVSAMYIIDVVGDKMLKEGRWFD